MPYYKWKAGRPVPAIEAQTFGEALENIEHNFGHVTARIVVDTASDPRSSIHAAFNWDDKEAADSFRLYHARKLISSLSVVKVQIERANPLEVREWYSTRESPSDNRCYKRREEILTSNDLRASVIEDARRELESFLKKYQGILMTLSPLRRVNDAIDLLRDEVNMLAAEASRRRSPEPQPKPMEATA